MNKSRFIIQFFILIVVVLIGSCSDDPVNTAKQDELDPPRFRWTADTLFSVNLLDIWAQDTNNVFFRDRFKLVYFNGSNYQFFDYSTDFFAYSMNGYNKSNVYLGGLDMTPSNLNRPKLKKWNGGSFKDFYVSDTANPRSIVRSICAVNPNEVWCGTQNGRVYNFNDINFKAFYFDTLMYIESFLKDVSNSLYFTGSIHKYNLSGEDTLILFVYKYNTSNWDKVFESRFIGYDTSFQIRNVGSEILGVSKNRVKKFTGNAFNTFISVNSNKFMIMYPYFGSSLKEILFSGSNNGLVHELYHWNGNRFSFENINNITTLSAGIYLTPILFEIQNTYYCSFVNPLFETIVLKGKYKGK